MRLHAGLERDGLRGSPRGGGLALREAHLLLVLFGKRMERNCQPGRRDRVRATRVSRVTKTGDASGIFFVVFAAERARSSRAKEHAHAPARARVAPEKIQGTRAKLSNRLFIVFTRAPPWTRVRMGRYASGCSPRTRGSFWMRSSSPSLRRWGDTREGVWVCGRPI